MTILLTGFEPFDGRATNASWDVTCEVAQGWTASHLVTRRLPVSFRGARQALRAAIAQERPALVVCLGEAGSRASVGLERVALNLVDAPIPDNDGSAPRDVPVVAGAPTAFLSTLPLRAVLTAAQSTGHPVEISGTAGTYVCNATFYALMHLLDRLPGSRGGFVHVPRSPSQVPPGEPCLEVAASAAVVRAVLTRALHGEAAATPGTVTGAEA